MQKALATQDSGLLQSSPGPAGLGVVVIGSAVVDAGAVVVLAVGVFASIIYCKDIPFRSSKFMFFFFLKINKSFDTNTDTHDRLETDKTKQRKLESITS